MRHAICPLCYRLYDPASKCWPCHYLPKKPVEQDKKKDEGLPEMPYNGGVDRR